MLKVAPDESPIDIQQILDFINNHQFDPKYIRKTVESLSWKKQMKRVIDNT